MDSETVKHQLRALRRFQTQACPDEVLALWAELADACPDNAKAQSGYGQCLIFADRYADAAPVLAKARELAPRNKAIRLLHLEIQSRILDFNSADAMWQVAVQNFPKSGKIFRAYSAFLVQSGYSNRALNVLAPACKEGHNAFDEGRSLLDNIQILIDLGRFDRAYDKIEPYLIARDMRPAIHSSISKISRYEVAQSGKRRRLFTEYFREVFRQNPDDFGAFQRLCFYLQNVDNTDGIEAATRKFKNKAENAETLRTQIDAIDSPRFKSCFTHKVWRIWNISGRSTKDWTDWINRAAWGDAARSIIQATLYAYGDNDRILADMFVEPDRKQLQRVFDGDTGTMIAAHHQSQSYLSIRLSRHYIPNFSTVLSAKHRGFYGESDLDVVMTQNELSSIRAIITSLKAGANIGMAVDYQSDSLDTEYDFKSGKLKLSTLMPRIIYKFGFENRWGEQYWIGSQIGMQFKAMPHPKELETETAFVRRWMKAFINKLNTCFEGDPANINFRHSLLDNYKIQV